jgi:hypothetical protein
MRPAPPRASRAAVAIRSGRSPKSVRRRLHTRSVSRKSASVRRSSRGRSRRFSGCSRQTGSLSPRTSGLSRDPDRGSRYSRSLRRHSGRTSALPESRCRQSARRRQRPRGSRLSHEERHPLGRIGGRNPLQVARNRPLKSVPKPLVVQFIGKQAPTLHFPLKARRREAPST